MSIDADDTAAARPEPQKCTDEHHAQLLAEVADLRRTTAAARYMQRAMREELGVWEGALAESEKQASMLAAFAEAHKHGDAKNVDEHVAMVMEQATQLKNAVQSYRESKETLRQPVGVLGRDDDALMKGIEADYLAAKQHIGTKLPLSVDSAQQ